MSYYEKISCRIAIQVCIGYFPDGRERHRTFSIKGIKPDAPLEAIASLARALAPVLAYPITKVRKVVKREIFFYEDAVMPIPLDITEPEARKIIFSTAFPIPERLVAAAILPFPSLSTEAWLKQMGFPSKRAPPANMVWRLILRSLAVMRTALGNYDKISLYAVYEPVGFIYASAPPTRHITAQLFRFTDSFVAIARNILQ